MNAAARMRHAGTPSPVCPQALTFRPSACGVLSTARLRSCQRSPQQHQQTQACSRDDRPAAQRSLDSLDLLLGSSASLDSSDAGDLLDNKATTETPLAEPAPQAVPTEHAANHDIVSTSQASQDGASVDACSSTLSNEELLEVVLAGKLTFSIARATAQGRAQKWLNDKLKPKDTLIHIGRSDVPGADVHVFTARPFLSYVVLVVNLSVYIAGLAVRFSLGSSSGEDYFYMLAKVNDEITHGEYYRLLTSAFLHDSFSHLALNTYALYTVAPQVESVLGYSTFLAVYLLSGLAGSSSAYIFGDTITVGASNCVFGLIGALAGYLWKNRSVHQSTDQLLSIAGFAAISLAMGSNDATAVDNVGHVAGGMAGIYLGWGMGPKLKAVSHNSPNGAAGSQAEAMQSLDDFEKPGAPQKGAPKELDAVDVISGVRRISVSISLLTALGAVTALKIIERAGHLSLPKGLGL